MRFFFFDNTVPAESLVNVVKRNEDDSQREIVSQKKDHIHEEVLGILLEVHTLKIPTPHKLHFLICTRYPSLHSQQYLLVKIFIIVSSAHSGSGISFVLPPHRHSWHSVIGALLSPCVLRRQSSERRVVVCPYANHTLRTSLTLWLCVTEDIHLL